MRPDEIVARIRALRLRNVELASLAGLDEMTVGRVLNGGTDPRISTLDKLGDAVVAEELRLLEHLIKLHPQPAQACAPTQSEHPD